MILTPQDKMMALCWLATQFVGVKEYGANKGDMVEKFQKAIDGEAISQAWCAILVAYCLKEVDEFGDQLAQANLDRTLIPLVDNTAYMFDKTPKEQVIASPVPGCIVVWQGVSNPNEGHCGIVVEVRDNAIVTVEGNTTSGEPGNQREGDGCYLRVRAGGQLGSAFKRLGYLLPWRQETVQ